MDSELCLSFGLGAIGKSVAACSMVKAGVKTVFADINQKEIDHINNLGGYWLGTADFYTKKSSRDFIKGVSAVNTGDEKIKDLALSADYYISAVGPKGFRALLPSFINWIKLRDEQDKKPLYYMVFENDHEATILLKEGVKEALGEIPSWLHISKCSIERMTKVIDIPELGATAVGETYYPVIADKKAMEGCGIYNNTEVLELVDDVERYYFRKLLTNNLGHAVLGYTGNPKGYTSTVEAMQDAEILELLKETLRESGDTLIAHYGFTKEEMDKHNADLLLRYSNPGLVDELERLTRDPIRKISPGERIMLPLSLSHEYGLKRTALLKTLIAAINYDNENVDGVKDLRELKNRLSTEGILKEICKLDGDLLKEAKELI